MLLNQSQLAVGREVTRNWGTQTTSGLDSVAS